MKTTTASLILLILCIAAFPACGGDSGMGKPPAMAEAAPTPALTSALRAESADLVIKGKIAGGKDLYLDLATLKTFPVTSFRAMDPWDKKEHDFSGLRLDALLAAAGIDPGASSVTLRAKNDYSAAIKRKDYEGSGYILAWAMDGVDFDAAAGAKKRAPLAVAIDFAAHPELDPEIYKHQLVWQVADITVE